MSVGGGINLGVNQRGVEEHGFHLLNLLSGGGLSCATVVGRNPTLSRDGAAANGWGDSACHRAVIIDAIVKIDVSIHIG